MLSFQEQLGESWGCVGTWPRGSKVQGANRHRFTAQPFPPRITARFHHASSRVVLTLTAHKSTLGGGGGGWVAVEKEFSQCHQPAPILLAKQTSQNTALPQLSCLSLQQALSCWLQHESGRSPPQPCTSATGAVHGAVSSKILCVGCPTFTVFSEIAALCYSNWIDTNPSPPQVSD